ncbi:MAG: hypothetical protein AAF607_11720 [Pseudomonadota bacterium]
MSKILYVNLVAALLLTGCDALENAKPETASSAGTTSPDPAAIEAEIWAKEAAIFEGRSRGDLSNYLSVTSKNYLGWPPVMAQPLPLDTFRQQSVDASALEGEEITFVQNGFTMNGNTAATYFTSHRTRLGKGFAEPGARVVDQYYENIHVWTLEEGEWRLISGMARLLPTGPREPLN